MRLPRLFRRRPLEREARALYISGVEQARRPVFYRELGVADTVEGRFDMVVLHVFLLLHRLLADGKETETVREALYETLFADLDVNLREIGVGDLAVGRRIRKMAEAFHGRIGAYHEALETGDDSALMAALDRNLYREVRVETATLAAMGAYVRAQARHLATQPTEALRRGRVDFAPPPTAGDGAPETRGEP